jgi:hypothetical protein
MYQNIKNLVKGTTMYITKFYLKDSGPLNSKKVFEQFMCTDSLVIYSTFKLCAGYTKSTELAYSG